MISNELEKELQDNGIMTPEGFSIEVERRVREDGEEGSYIEQTTIYLEELGLDADSDGIKLISQSLKDKIQREAEDKNLLKVKNTTTRLF